MHGCSSRDRDLGFQPCPHRVCCDALVPCDDAPKSYAGDDSEVYLVARKIYKVSNVYLCHPRLSSAAAGSPYQEYECQSTLC